MDLRFAVVRVFVDLAGVFRAVDRLDLAGARPRVDFVRDDALRDLLFEDFDVVATVNVRLVETTVTVASFRAPCAALRAYRAVAASYEGV